MGVAGKGVAFQEKKHPKKRIIVVKWNVFFYFSSSLYLNTFGRCQLSVEGSGGYVCDVQGHTVESLFIFSPSCCPVCRAYTCYIKYLPREREECSVCHPHHRAKNHPEHPLMQMRHGESTY